MNDDVPPPHREAAVEQEVRRIQKALRRIIRANDMQSRALAKATGLTTAQFVILRGVVELGEVTTTALSAYADLSAATVVTVLETLEQRGIVERYRSTADRRIVHTRLTEKGRAVVDAVPGPAGTRFALRFASLPEEQRREIVEAVETLAGIL